MPGYSALPLVYDEWQSSFGKDYSSLIFPRVIATLRRYRVSPGLLIDLGCGTGTLALLFERKGWDVTGVDASDGMIEKAKEKKSNGRARFICQDMRSFDVPARATVVTSMFDTINHLLTTGDLAKTFRRVYRHLVPGGYFVFDVNNVRCFALLWDGPVVQSGDSYSLILESSFNLARRSAYSDVTLFVRDGEGFQRHRETVRERLFTNRELETALRRAGFLVCEAVDFNFTARRDVGKIKTWWVARKP